MIKNIMCYAEPKTGHEAEYYKAMIDRHNASMEMLKMGLLARIFQPFRYNRVFNRWADAVDRMKEHGQDRVEYIGK
jgi:hypothetical protein